MDRNSRLESNQSRAETIEDRAARVMLRDLIARAICGLSQCVSGRSLFEYTKSTLCTGGLKGIATRERERESEQRTSKQRACYNGRYNAYAIRLTRFRLARNTNSLKFASAGCASASSRASINLFAARKTPGKYLGRELRLQEHNKRMADRCNVDASRDRSFERRREFRNRARIA